MNKNMVIYCVEERRVCEETSQGSKCGILCIMGRGTETVRKNEVKEGDMRLPFFDWETLFQREISLELHHRFNFS